MKIKSVPVNRGKPPVLLGIVEVPEYESLSEAISSLGESRCLSLVNRMLKKEITQDLRNNSKEKSTIKKLKSMGISLSDMKEVFERINKEKKE